ncbi:putative beta-glucosidase [Dioszegia hungarica]|uniref:beta-glucosidase n=1 Tax=Dioszegia hungarica TaxID=4972 RepID=A0AA38H357_9TREE|nr:putative beta-glucosidase [Dioszegia hungarica]KAI9632811.1 putative beta-glucosidase [Dioszegia hungarica]
MSTAEKTKTNDQMDRSFLDASIPELLKQLTMEEKISLLAGKDWWNTVPVPRLNIPSVKVTDGPNGARGESFYHMCPASAIPCATALGATFSTSLIETAAHLLAKETKARNATCLLAPTINIQRSPLGGRAFESYSEDPTHSGLIAAAYVKGLQDNGVSATIKHFVANDGEHERNGVDSIMAERTLREVYLRPFQIAQAKSQPWAYMTSYNKLNGTHCSEDKWLLQDLLRGEWKHDGLVMSDWFGTYSVSESINAGLNVEMPGPTVWRGSHQVNHLIRAHKINPRAIDKVVGETLTWVQKLTKANTELVYAKPSKEKTRSSEQTEDAKVIRKLAADGTVLLKNEKEVLPIQGKRKVGIMGPNAKAKVLTGGGSAQLRSLWSQSPWEGLEANKPEGVELEYTLGAYTAKFLPVLDENFTAASGNKGFDLKHYPLKDEEMSIEGSEPAVTEEWDESSMFMAEGFPQLGPQWLTELTSTLTSPIDGEYEFSLAVTGQAKLWVDGELVVDNTVEQVRGTSFFNCGTVEVKGSAKVQKGKTYQVRALHDARAGKFAKAGANTPFRIVGIRVGAFPVFDADQAIEDAVKLAKSVDTAVIVAGLNADWESEGYDRPTLSLPLRSDELISRVAAANPNTVVVIQAGSAVSMPWINDVAGVVYAWYGGNETGNAIADIVYGSVNPSGRLPISLPVREQDIAASQNFKSARTKIHYEEGIWVGYKHHNARGIAPLFPYGHGLSYTSFAYSGLKITGQPKEGVTDAKDWMMDVEVTVENTGKKAGSHSVHFYTCPPNETETGLRHPSHSLQAFGKVENLQPGKKETVKVTLDKYAISHWDDLYKTFRAEQGEWTIKIGRDAQTLEGEVKFTIEEDLEWRGL